MRTKLQQLGQHNALRILGIIEGGVDTFDALIPHINHTDDPELQRAELLSVLGILEQFHLIRQGKRITAQ